MADKQTEHQAHRETRPLSLLERALEEAATAEENGHVRALDENLMEIEQDTYRMAGAASSSAGRTGCRLLGEGNCVGARSVR